MKVLVMNLLAVIVAVALTGKLDAKTTSNNNLNMVGKTINYSSKDLLNLTVEIYEARQIKLISAEERKVYIQVDDTSPNSTASATISVNSTDGLDEFGPYTVNEGETLIVTIDERDWLVETLSSSQNAEVTYWITE